MRFPCLRIPCTPIGWPTVSLWLPLNAPPGTPYCGSSECWPGGCRRAAPGLPGLRPALVNGTTSWLCPVNLTPAGRHPTPLTLGALATAWPRLRTVTSAEELTEALRRSPWGDSGSDGTTALRDVLTLVWLRRLADVAPAARPWAEAACALTAARILLVDGAVPSPRILQLVRPFLGRTWETAEDLTELHAALPPSAQPV